MSIDNLSNNKGLNITSNPSGNIFDTNNTQDYNSLNLNNRSSHNLEVSNNDASATASSTVNYNSTNGYGLVNAAAAVSAAAGQSTYKDVANLGGNNWGADLVKAPEVWANGYTGKGVVVAVIDTGVDYNHEDLKNNIWTNTKEIAGNGIDDDSNGYVDDVHGWNFNGSNNNTLDDNGHGTHVSGTIAGENNGYGVTGIAYNSQIMAVKVLNGSGSGSYSAIANGIYYAVDNGANVINLSLGGDYSNRTLKSAVEYASSKGVIVVMAAGNDGDSSPDYPARYANNSGIAVGAVDRNNNLADFSNRSGSSEITYVTAPGVDVYSTVPNNQYAAYSGTSMASPHVAGVVALMLSANSSLTESQIRQIITGTAGNSTQTTASNLDSAVSQFFTETPVNSIFAKTSNVNSFTQSELKNFSSNPITVVESDRTSAIPQLNVEFRYYQDALDSSITSSPGEVNDGNNIDIVKIIDQLKKQMQEYQKWLGQ